MKETSSENISIARQSAEKIPTIHALGIGVFFGSIVWLIYAYFTKSSDWQTSTAFFTMLLGAGLFTFDPTLNYHPFSIYSRKMNIWQRLAMAFGAIGLACLISAWAGFSWSSKTNFLLTMYGSMSISFVLYIHGTYSGHTKGIKNNYVWFNSLTNRGILGWAAAILFTVFYIHLYISKDALNALAPLFDPLSQLFRNKPSDKWFVYGTFYTFLILTLGIKFIIKYRHNAYQRNRTLVVIFSQLVFAYFIPNILEALNYDSAMGIVDGKEVYLGYYSANPVNSWPLNYEFFSSGHLAAYTQESYQPVGLAYLVWGFLLFLIGTPILTYYVGKRWYCSWVCGCGGLAETAGDSFRHLSNKTVKAWKIERWIIHSVMVFVLIMTLAILVPFFTGKEFAIGVVAINKPIFVISSLALLAGLGWLFFRWNKKQEHRGLQLALIALTVIALFLLISFFSGSQNAFIIKSATLKKVYGFFVGTTFSGVIGVGFYPILGNRVWCRFGCPMAGYMGLFQRFKSRFRITTNGGQCISCGNCSTYCEQGIDVRAYAQRQENIVRASCVGCGVCSAVCPRGVLKLENGPEEGRFNLKDLMDK